MIGQSAGEHGGLERHGGTQIVGLKRLRDPVVQLLAAVYGDVLEAHASLAVRDVVLDAGDLPFALALRLLLFGVIDDAAVRITIEQPVRDVELAHFRNAVARVQEDVRQQALALEIAVKRLLGLLLGHGEGDNQLRLYAALDAIREDRRAAAIRALRRCGRAFGHQLRTAALADVSLHRFSIAWLKGIRRHRKLHAVIPLVGIHGFNGLYIVAIAA